MDGAGALPVGGSLLQAEDELASVNMIIGASYGGVPSLTATAGPGLALMTEGIGLAVAAEVPIVVVDVMRGGPSTGIPAKSEQSDLSFAVDGLHGDAPRLVLAPNGIADCLATTEWAVQLAEALQSPALLLSDQFMGQSRAVIDQPTQAPVPAQRLVAAAHTEGYQRYADTPSGISPMAIPGTPGTPTPPTAWSTPSAASPAARRATTSAAGQAPAQADAARLRLTLGRHRGRRRSGGDHLRLHHRRGARGRGPRRRGRHCAAPGVHPPAGALKPEVLAQALDGVRQVLVVEQNHGGQLLRYLRSRCDLPGRPLGPAPPRPAAAAPG
jgi:2-oxoglutarate ferredoxin oxidoreductase subunit alpha